MVRGFARWMAAFDPATEVSPADLLPVSSRRADPYPYSNDDIAGLMQAARAIRTKLNEQQGGEAYLYLCKRPGPGGHDGQAGGAIMASGTCAHHSLAAGAG
jgi:hypothetical protein